MDKRSWPWRKKPSERPSSASETSESSSFPSARHLDYQDVSTMLSDHPRVTDDGATQWQDNEETIKVLNDRLSAALLDAANKEMLAKQHAKLAEEAVSGWETVEVEAASLKQQLESTIQQKLATEDRVSHLDGALKECMRQLRNVREEQEENIHNAIMKKTREWDRKRYELEEKIADLEQKFFEKDAENRAMSRSLQERTRSISEISNTCSKAQTNATMLEVRLESLEKEKATLKYELNVAHKELDIRNEEKGLSKRAADAASKQHMEDVKKIAKLDAECQRLRGLLRKKLPGPGAIAQMKLEFGPVSEKIDGRKRNGRGVITSRDSSLQGIIQEDNLQYKEGDNLSDRYSSLEEETKLLREMLAKRNNELQSVRLMCARTASKLSSVEQELEKLNSSNRPHKVPVLSGLEMLSCSVEPSFAPVSEDGNDGDEVSCAESWASALIAELDQFKKGKSMPMINQIMSASNMGAPDDFRELERLASLHPSDTLGLKLNPFDDHEAGAAIEQSLNVAGLITEENTLSEDSPTKEAVLHVAYELCEEGTTKLAAREGPADQASFINLKQKLCSLFEESADVAELLEQIRADIGLQGPLPVNMRSSLICNGCSHDGSLDHKSARQHTVSLQDVLSCSSKADHMLYGAVLELTLAVCKVAQLLEDFVATSTTENQCPAPGNELSTLNPTEVHAERLGQNVQLPEIDWLRTHEFDAKWQELVVVSNNFLNGKVELKLLLVAISSALGQFSRIKLLACNNTNKGSIQISGEMEFTGAIGSPMSDTSKSECSEAAAKIVPADENTHTCGKDILSPQVLRLEDELRKALSEISAMETCVKTEEGRFIETQQELLQLKAVKEELEATLEKDRVELEHLRLQRHETDQMLSNFRAQLAAAESSKHLAGQQLIDMAVSKDELDSQLHACKTDLSNLHDHVKVITSELSGERKKNSDLEAKCEELQDQLDVRSGLSCPQCAMAAGEKEQMSRELKIAEATEKLAECERTIYVLGHQLKALSSPNGSPHPAIQSSPSFDQAQPDIITCLRSHSSTGYDNAWEGGSSARFVKPRDFSRNNPWEGPNSARYSEPRDFLSGKTSETINEDAPWDPRQSIASDILDSELISLSVQGQTSGRKMYDMFGDKVPVHEDYIEAVAQMPSSPEAEAAASPKKFASKPPRRKKRSPRSFAGVDMSKSMNDACSPSSAEKHGSSFSRFFSRTKINH